eukprot:TRINITY_DN27090_c0_g1_i1.p1 TRINITY_DN27090_c0_g1~~TRINITY_DN27090_c0_g1_i1.p1  ORF type:complete len:963 (+),score=119.27 TRINITY_DN27090_c0_g1_i1:50-2938(+)
MSKKVAVRLDDPTTLPKMVSCHSRCLFTLKRAIGEGVDISLQNLIDDLKEKVVHPNLAEVLGHVQVSPNNLRLVSVSSDYTMAVQLDKLYSLKKGVSADNALTMLRGVVSGLAHLHKHEVVVGTLHPGRIVIDSQGVPKISDFLLGKLTEYIDTNPSFERQPDPYVAPEIQRRISTWGIGGEAADSWSVGVGFLELLTAPVNPWRSSGIDFFRQHTVADAEEIIVDFTMFAHGDGQSGSAGKNFHDCLEKLRRKTAGETALKTILRLVHVNPANRTTAMVMREEFEGELGTDNTKTNSWLQCIRSAPEKIKTHRTPHIAEGMLSVTYRNADTDLGRVLTALEAIKANLLNTKRDAMTKATARIVSDSHLIESSLNLYTKIGKTAEENALTLLRDKGMNAAAPRTTVPLLFRCPSGYSKSKGSYHAGPTGVWRENSYHLLPLKWFAAATHTLAPERTDSLEDVGGFSNYPVKAMEKDGHRKSKASLRETLLKGNEALRDGLVEELRDLLIQYPDTRAEVIGLAARDGVPALLRGGIWKAALGVSTEASVEKQYWAVDTSITTADDDQVAKDVPRCHQYNRNLGSPAGRKRLSRILKTWVINGGDIGVGRYIQGMASLAAPFIATLSEDEPGAYQCYTNLLNGYAYLGCDPSSGYDMLRPKLYSHFALHDAEIWKKLSSLELPDDVFLSRLRTHFAHDLPLEKIFLIWDAILLGKRDLIYALALSFLASKRTELLTCIEVTDATQIWKNSLLEVNIHDCIRSAKSHLKKTPTGLEGPPTYMEPPPGVLFRPLPCAWIEGDNFSRQKTRIIIDASWKGSWASDVHVPLHEKVSETVVAKLERYLVAKGLSKTERYTGIRIGVVGFTPQAPLWGRPLPVPYCPGPDLVTALVSKGWSGVVTVISHPPESGGGADVTITPHGPLPGSLPEEPWRLVADFLLPEELITLEDVCPGLSSLISVMQGGVV